MKTLLLTVATFALVARLTSAELPLTWTDPNPPGSVGEFRVYRRYDSGTAQLRVLLGISMNQFYSIPNYNGGESNQVFSVTATNRFGESNESTPLVGPHIQAPVNLANRALQRTWTIPPAGLLQRSHDLATWSEHLRNLNTNPITVRVSEDAFGRQQFYRLATNQLLAAPLPGGGK